MAKDVVRVGGNEVVSEGHVGNPVFGVFDRVLERMGGEDRIVEWAEDNFGDFIKLYARLSPEGSRSGSQINIQVNAALGPSPLDGESDG